MKECPNCKALYRDFDNYCFKCNRKLVTIQNSKVVDYCPESTGAFAQKTKQQTQHIPKCPTCQSPNIEKISAIKKVIGGALFGLFSSDVQKTMHCKNCGYKW